MKHKHGLYVELELIRQLYGDKDVEVIGTVVYSNGAARAFIANAVGADSAISEGRDHTHPKRGKA